MKKLTLFLLLFTWGCSTSDQPTPTPIAKPSILVVNGGDNSISVIHPESQQEIKRLFLKAPANTFVHHISHYQNLLAFALPEYDFANGHNGLHGLNVKGYIGLMDTQTGQMTQTIEVPYANHNAVLANNGKEVWTSLVSHTGRVQVYDTKTGVLIKEIIVNPDPHEIIFTKDEKYALITCMESSFLTVIDVSNKQILREIKVDHGPTNVWPGQKDYEVIVENANAKSLNFVNLHSFQVFDHIDLDFTPGYSQFIDDELWVCAKGQNFLYVFTPISGSWQLKQKIATQNDPHHFLVKQDQVWLVNQKENTVEIFDRFSKQKVNTLYTGSKPNYILHFQ